MLLQLRRRSRVASVETVRGGGHEHTAIREQVRSTRSLRIAGARLAAAILLVALPLLAATAGQPATTAPDFAAIDRYVESEMRAAGAYPLAC